MKAVMLSVRPKWCELIANGRKTLELRKSIPKLEAPFKCYIYCTQSGDALCPPHANSNKWSLHRMNNGTLSGRAMTPEEMMSSDYNFANGKVIGEFTCDQAYQYSTSKIDGINISDDEITKRSCLTKAEIEAYEFSASYKDFEIYNIGVYGWNIADLKIYDQPKQLSDFKKPCISPKYPYCPNCKVGIEYISEEEAEYFREVGTCDVEWVCLNHLKRPPQPWCYVED